MRVLIAAIFLVALAPAADESRAAAAGQLVGSQGRTPNEVFKRLSSPSAWSGAPRPYRYAAERTRRIPRPFVGIVAVGFVGGRDDYIGLTIAQDSATAAAYFRDKVKAHRGIRYSMPGEFRWTEVQRGKSQDCEPAVASCYETVLGERVGPVVTTVRSDSSRPASAQEVQRLASLEAFAAERVRQAERSHA